MTADINDTDHGAIRLVVAGNNVSLGKGDFSKIDDGWQVSKTINSSAIQNISANIPWYFETRDRAGNVRRTSGSISSTARAVDVANTTTTATTLLDSRFVGSLNPQTFSDSRIRVTRKDAAGNPVVSNAQPITEFAAGTGQFTFTNTVADPLFTSSRADDPGTEDVNEAQTEYRCPFDPDDRAEDQDAVPPITALEIGADDDSATDQITFCAALEVVEVAGEDDTYKSSSYEILGSNLVTVDSEEPTLTDSDVWDRHGIQFGYEV